MYKSRIQNAKSRAQRNDKSRAVEEPDDAQEYAVVQDMLGNGRVRLQDAEGNTLIGRIRGSMRRARTRTLIERGDLVIVARWDFEPDKGDIVHKYTHEEMSMLAHRGHLPKAIKRAITAQDPSMANMGDDEDACVAFVDDDDIAAI